MDSVVPEQLRPFMPLIINIIFAIIILLSVGALPSGSIFCF